MTLMALCADLSRKLASYRAADGYSVDEDHVARWVYQFDDDVRAPLLTEMNHVVDATYFSETEVREFFSHQIKNNRFVGDNPEAFWRRANILDIQGQGQSQAEIARQFFQSLNEQLGLLPGNCGNSKEIFVYLDDAIFSGNRAGGDLVKWLRTEMPASGLVKILVIATYEFGEYQLRTRLNGVAKELGLDIKFEIWAAIRLENRKYRKNVSEILWPKTIPDDASVNRYLSKEHRFPFEPRTFDCKLALPIFTGSSGRALLETEMLKAGARIIEFSKSPSEIVRPLGFGAFGVGFGATVVTYRNCPNNCPLAWWWGDPTYRSGHPFSKWHPLIQRKTYGGHGFDAIHF